LLFANALISADTVEVSTGLPTKIDKLPLVFGWRPQGRRRTEHAYAPDLLERCQVNETDHRHRRLLRARRMPRWD
jgi:hypothetical protein